MVDQDQRTLRLRLFALSFTALFLELMVIRWAPSVVRVVAFYANLMLISSFLGLGIGAMSSTRRWRVFAWFPLLLAVDVGVLLSCRALTLPGAEGEARFFAASPQFANYCVLFGIFTANAAMFVPLGQEIGSIFRVLPTLSAYAWDLGGSLCGTLCFGLFSLRYFSPAVGIAAVMILYASLSQKKHLLWTIPLFVLTLIAVARSNDRPALWSPYYYITIRDARDVINGGEGGEVVFVSEPVTHLRKR